MELTITALVLFVGMIASWLRLPGGIASEATFEEPQTATPGFAH